MKTLIKIPIILFLILLASCSKDVEIEGNDLSGQLEGAWNVKFYDYEGSNTTILNEDVSETEFHGFGWEMNITMTFSKDPNDYDLNGNYTINHFYTNETGEPLVYLGQAIMNQDGIWSRNGHKLNIIIDGKHKRGFISKLTDSSMIITINSSRTETESDGAVSTTENSEIYTLERINN